MSKTVSNVLVGLFAALIVLLLAFAVKNKASDLHLSAGLPPMIRVDGDVRRINVPALEHKEVHALIYEVMDDRQRKDYEEFYETDFSFEVPGVARFRVNVFNQNRGAGGVFRTIPSKVLTMEDLAMGHVFRDISMMPRGLVLVTGPTGSGKTTTLYSGLTELNTADKKIITVEDPVEYRLPRVNQVQINEKIGLTFAKVLRATLRQDPDVLLVGEIRDRESAEIAMRAAMTGHLVLSTLHTNDACSSPLRLVDMGVDPYLVASSLKAVVAQRLLRRLCDKCAKSHQPDAGEKQLIEMISKLREIKATDYRTAVGCPHCFNTGYRGRVGAFEWLEVNDEMADHLRENNSRGFLKAVHQSRTFRPLSVSAMEYAEKGITSLSEVMRVSAQLEDEQLTDVD